MQLAFTNMLSAFALSSHHFYAMKKLITALFIFTTMATANAQKVMPLYTDSIPNSILTKDEEKSENNGILIISNVSRPTITAYLPPKEKSTGTAVIICPGGGYAVLAASHEGADVAKAFNAMGVAAFVLKYRLPNGATMPNKQIGPLQDAQQAIKMVREHAAAYNINPKQIGIMGFSAGGHLASTAGTHYTKAVVENNNGTSLRPDFMLLIYPVISFSDSLTHMGSRENLVGKNPSAETITLFSNELQVTADTPPTFLVHASDDDAVKVGNSIAFYEACIKNKVPVEMHIYQNGGHGFGMHIAKTKELWMERCKNWMAANGWLPALGVKVPIDSK